MRPSDPPEIQTSRLVLTRLQPANAEEMTEVLADQRLYEFIGGAPPSLAELQDRYLRLAAGAVRPAEIWLNWIVRLRDTRQPIGTVQATVRITAPGDITAEGPARAGGTAWVAWVIGAGWQGRGYASEAAAALVTWLRGQGATAVHAAIHPAHLASKGVARRAGLAPTGAEVDGEQVWSLTGG